MMHEHIFATLCRGDTEAPMFSSNHLTVSLIITDPVGYNSGVDIQTVGGIGGRAGP